MKKILLVLVLLLTLLVPSLTRADGGIMPRPNYWIHETDQKAVIISENGVETMILSTSYRGDAKDFAWIIPTPSKPEVTKGAVNIFEALQDYVNVYESYNRIYDSIPLGVSMEKAAPTVNVIEQKKIGFYDIAVLESNDKDALYNWLKENNYNYPDYGKVILDDYIQNKWFFTAVKISAENTDQAENDLNSGTITPLKLVFPTDKIVFPLKISSITMKENIPDGPIYENSDETTTREIAPIYPSNYMDIRLYVFADHKKQVGNFTTSYAKWVNSKTIREFATDDNGDPWYSPSGKKMFLTVLYDNMSTKDMKSDLFLINAKDNDSIPASQFWANFFLTIFFILLILASPFGLLYIIFMLLFIFIKSRPIKVVFLLLQGFITLIGIILSIIFLVSLLLDNSLINEIISLLISCTLVTIAMLVGMILEIVLGKRKGLL